MTEVSSEIMKVLQEFFITTMKGKDKRNIKNPPKTENRFGECLLVVLGIAKLPTKQSYNHQPFLFHTVPPYAT